MNGTIGGVIVAAGEGTRMGGALRKVYVPLAGRPLFMHALEKMRSFHVPWIALVIHPEELFRTIRILQEAHWIEDDFPGEWEYFPGHIVQIELAGPTLALYLVPGGKSRQDSVWAGVRVLEKATYVAVHDAARPLLSLELWQRLVAVKEAARAIVPALPVKDTIKVIEEAKADLPSRSLRRVWGTLPRTSLVAVQTPQLFHRATLLEALALGRALQIEVTDEAMLLERFRKRVVVVPGDEANIKVTTPFDLSLAEMLLKKSV
ncbi:MAG: 2-C-methyl-D-erythritol 4-phosphate cytidylyltransferase [Candidatus Carbobacillus altaicus]|nr:2-C-methyl-D-erythritol 4-phosphate cytidylyltransferase [Candidatus Carbobacillus altaicus]